MKPVQSIFVAGLVLALAASTATAELKPEKLTREPLKAANPHRIYLTDLALQHVIDGRIHVIDGDGYRYLGLIGTGMFGLTALSPDSSQMYVATTYYTKRNRGKRFDLFEAYSTEDLKLQVEIEIPPKHAHALPYKGTMIGSQTSRFVYIQNSTPASSISVVDLKNEKFVTEIPTPGCWIIMPSQSSEKYISTLCGDGTILTIALNENGESAGQQRSEKLFDADRDPLFVQAEHIGDTYYFVSYNGMIHEINVGGPVAKTEKTWSLVSDEEKAAAWKPGGYQLLALDKKRKRLFVGMHEGAKDGSHKWPAKEIWGFDLTTQKRVDRAPGGNSIAMTATKEDEPFLYLYDGLEAKFHKYATHPKLTPVDTSPPFGEFAGLVETH